MTRLLLASILIWMASLALAQIPGPPNLTTNSPYPFVPLPPGQYGLAPTSSTALTIPALSTYATICAETATVRYTTDGATTPTSSIGIPILTGVCVGISGPLPLKNFRAFSATGTLDIEFFK
jgi:hypothetical protein